MGVVVGVVVIVIVRMIVIVVVIVVVVVVVIVVVVAGGFGFVAGQDVEFGGGDAIAQGFGDFEFGTEAEVLEAVDEFVGVGAGVEEGADGHVAADSREGVEVGNSHRVPYSIEAALGVGIGFVLSDLENVSFGKAMARASWAASLRRMRAGK
jgi:hypothetical protein